MNFMINSESESELKELRNENLRLRAKLTAQGVSANAELLAMITGETAEARSALLVHILRWPEEQRAALHRALRDERPNPEGTNEPMNKLPPPDRIYAPWTDEQVAGLNRSQRGIGHPYACGGDRYDERHLDGEGALIATRGGWVCPYCDYTQNWAHASSVMSHERMQATLDGRYLKKGVRRRIHYYPKPVFDGAVLNPAVTAEQILACLFAEFSYWNQDKVHPDIAIGATGALSNVIAFATVEGLRAGWHPEK